MTVIPLGTDDIQSHDETASRIRLENMYLIDSPFSPDGISRVSRPTLTNVLNLGIFPIYGMYREDGVFGGEGFVVSGTTLYQINLAASSATMLGSIPGAGYCQFSGGATSAGSRLLILRDGAVWNWDGSTITQIAMPDAVPVGSICYLEDFFFLSVLNIQAEFGRFYWISPGITDPDPLDFATAERRPDDLSAVVTVGDELWMLGTESGEVWIASGNSDAPFQAVQARAYNYGCLSRETVAESTLGGSPCILWVTNNLTVAMGQANSAPIKVSNDSVDEILKTATNFRAYGFRYNRHSFYILTCDAATFVYDIAKRRWSRWSSYLLNNWRAHLGFQDGELVFAGDSLSGTIYRFDEGTDDDGDAVVRTASGLVIFAGNYMPCTRVNVIMNAGWTESYGPSAVLELCWSDDVGFTYSDYIHMPMGQKGAYQNDVTFSGLGMIRRPGRLFKFRFSDKSRFRLDYATMNEM